MLFLLSSKTDLKIYHHCTIVIFTDAMKDDTFVKYASSLGMAGCGNMAGTDYNIDIPVLIPADTLLNLGDR